MVSAKLGLPIGLKFSLKVASLDLSIGLIDEPSAKGVAQYSGSIEGDSKGSSNAFKETGGRKGKLVNRGYIKIPGVEMLKDPCLTHTVTGGDVMDCMVTWLVQGEYETSTKITGCLMIGGNGSDYSVGVEDVARNG
ncbi:hypothetical protein NW754_010274 [Fusarium falciforme]|nr:hypothetical protein NW754_010274 [Fusarium falciforme]